MSESAGDSTLPENARESSSRESAGARLTAERRKLGLSIGDIARQLKLSVRQVEALERDDYAAFAGPVFVRGFMRNYAKLLRLDADELLATASPAAPAPTPSAMSQPIDEERHAAASPERSRRIFASLAIAALVIVAIVLLASNAAKDRRGDASSNDVPALQPPPANNSVAQSETRAISTPVPSADAAAAPQGNAASTAQGETVRRAPEGQATETPSASSTAPVESAAPPADHASTAAATDAAAGSGETPAKPRVWVTGKGAAQVHMVFEGESWVEVKDSTGATIFSRLNPAGTERLIRGTPPLTLVVGNAANVKLLYHEKPVDLQPHTHIDVARITLE